MVMGVMWMVGGCTCGPQPTPDAGSPAEALSWPPGARLVVVKTTSDSAELEWPQATGPVTTYRLSSGDTTRDTTSTNTAFTGLRVGEHLAVSVVAVAEDGTMTEPLRAEVAPAEPLAVTEGDISTDFCGANAFLARGVLIPCDELAVITGHVRTADGVGVPGLRVSVLKHPEWGTTTTQADGLYALAVSTGRHTLDLRAPSFLPLQRQVTAPAHLFTVAPDTVVLRRDEKATTLSTVTGGFHRANEKEDEDGKRSTAVFIPAGTSASLKLPDGGTQPTTTLTLRATEATVGPSGPEQMPASICGLNQYAYVENDPLAAIDPSGLEFLDLTEREVWTIKRLEQNPIIGAQIRELSTSKTIAIRLRATTEPQGGRWVDWKQKFRGSECTMTSATLNYDLGAAQSLSLAHFGLKDTGIDVLIAHELGHFTGMLDGLSVSDRNLRSVEWENAVRAPGPTRPRHEP
jgi:hypothetical protein